MADWSAQTFSTLTTITKWEADILDFTSAADNDYLATAVDIADDTDPITALVTSVDVSAGKGVTEIIGVVNTTGYIKKDYSLTISIRDSADDSTFAEIDAGQRVYYRTTSLSNITLTAGDVLFRWVVPSHCEDYVKCYITSSANNAGNIDIYTISKWSDKITQAVALMGVDVEMALVSRGYSVDYDADEVLLDVINNPTDFIIPCDFKTLQLIYEDLSGGDEDSGFWKKALWYKQRYEIQLKKATNLVDLDTDLDGDTDEHNVQKAGQSRTSR